MKLKTNLEYCHVEKTSLQENIHLSSGLKCAVFAPFLHKYLSVKYSIYSI